MGQSSSKKSRSKRQNILVCTKFVVRIESRPQHNEPLATNDQNITINTADEHKDQHNVDSNADGVEPETNYLTHLPMDLILEIFSRLDVINIISLQPVNKSWCEILRSQKLWRVKCQQYWPNYPLHAIGDYFKFFLQRGGVYFIRSAEHLNRLATTQNEKYHYNIIISNRHELPNGLVLVFEKNQKRYRRKASKEFWSKRAIEFNDGSNLVLAPKFLEDEEYDYILLEESFNEEYFAIFDKRKLSNMEVYSEKKIINVILQMMNALKTLQEQNIVVGDWNDTSFVADICGDWFELKMERYMPRYAIPPSTGIPHISFMAPEAITSQATIQSDMWTLGIVVYTLLTGLPTFYGPNWKVEYDAICKGEFTWPENTPISDLAKDFVNHLILLDPLQRLTLKAAFEHPWITNPNPSTVWLEAAEKEFLGAMYHNNN